MEVPQGLPNPLDLIKVPLKLSPHSRLKPHSLLLEAVRVCAEVKKNICVEHKERRRKRGKDGGVLEGCSVPPGCCEAGPVKGELQTKVFYSSGANGDK